MIYFIEKNYSITVTAIIYFMEKKNSVTVKVMFYFMEKKYWSDSYIAPPPSDLDQGCQIIIFGPGNKFSWSSGLVLALPHQGSHSGSPQGPTTGLQTPP